MYIYIYIYIYIYVYIVSTKGTQTFRSRDATSIGDISTF